jgi:hypothetical protein
MVALLAAGCHAQRRHRIVVLVLAHLSNPSRDHLGEITAVAAEALCGNRVWIVAILVLTVLLTEDTDGVGHVCFRKSPAIHTVVLDHLELQKRCDIDEPHSSGILTRHLGAAVVPQARSSGLCPLVLLPRIRHTWREAMALTAQTIFQHIKLRLQEVADLVEREALLEEINDLLLAQMCDLSQKRLLCAWLNRRQKARALVVATKTRESRQELIKRGHLNCRAAVLGNLGGAASQFFSVASSSSGETSLSKSSPFSFKITSKI